jgi:hypothetical protein
MNDDNVKLSELLPDVPMQFLPSPFQYGLWKDWVDWDAGADPDGNFLGSCPLHDKSKEETSAVYNFDRGVLRCQNDPSCHAPKRAMALGNVTRRMQQ